jgi:hypothetical protein
MRRALFILLSISAITWFEFSVFPGHTYLRGDTQVLLPILERLDTPGYLSRDLVATHPHLTYTIYDEAALFLHEAGAISFQRTLTLEQIVCRIAGVIGVFLLGIAAGFTDPFALLLSGLVNLGATLTGPATSVIDPEPTPHAFAFGLILLALGLLAREKPLLGGLVAGLALLFHAPTAAPFWMVVIVAFLFDRRLRILFRPLLSILVVFILLLGNLAQLQPGIVEPEPFFARISNHLAALQHFRIPQVWVSTWAGHDIWIYLAVWICAVWATARLWPSLNRQLRWFVIALPLAGILSVPFSYLLLEHLRWSLVPALEPARTLVYTVAIAVFVCAAAGIQAAVAHRPKEAVCWFIAVAVVQVPAVPGRIKTHAGPASTSVVQLADWAENNTWGSSMFLFPDAGRGLHPGMFRAGSRRALWVDWESGVQMRYFESVADEWWQRWRQTMDPDFSPPRLEAMLPLPVDYYVLQRAHQLTKIKPVFQNRDFVVYDAADLRDASAVR